MPHRLDTPDAEIATTDQREECANYGWAEADVRGCGSAARRDARAAVHLSAIDGGKRVGRRRQVGAIGSLR